MCWCGRETAPKVNLISRRLCAGVRGAATNLKRGPSCVDEKKKKSILKPLALTIVVRLLEKGFVEAKCGAVCRKTIKLSIKAQRGKRPAQCVVCLCWCESRRTTGEADKKVTNNTSGGPMFTNTCAPV